MRILRSSCLGRLALTALLAVGVSSPASGYGRGDKGRSGAPLLKIGPGARPAGMGEAFVAVADDIHAIYYNPAGLAGLKQVEVTGMHNAYLQGVNYEFGAVSVPLLRWVNTKLERNLYGVMGFAVYNLEVKGIERRGFTETDLPTETFGSNDFVYALSYAYPFPETGFSLGVTAKLIDLNIDHVHARGFAADAGLLQRWEKLSLGLGLRHGGTVQRLGRAKDALPMTLFSGMGYRITERLQLAADANLAWDNKLHAAVGAEYKRSFTRNLRGALRAGYNSRNTDAAGLTGPSIGGGVGLAEFYFDFAWVPFGDLGHTFRYSLQAKF